MTTSLPKALYESSLSTETSSLGAITHAEAERLFSFFRDSPLFNWTNAANDCEDRANAICMLLDNWNISNYKAWVFSGAYLKKMSGNLINFWKYHVAAAVPVSAEGGVRLYIIDPGTVNEIVTLHDWADAITIDECSYYLVRESDDYIFHHHVINNDNWHKRNKQNFKWTIQGLAGINGVSATGKAQLVFKKQKIATTERSFKALMRTRPF